MSVRIHRVQPGETLVSIAEHYNFRSWQTIAELEENADLIAIRGSAHAIVTGDKLAIPEPSVGVAELAPGREHTFKARVPAKQLVIRVYTEFRRLKENLKEVEIVAGRKSQTVRGWIRGGTVPPLPVREATILMSGPAEATRSAKTDRRGRVWVEALGDGDWTLIITPINDELSKEAASPTKDVDHGKDWTKGTKAGQRSVSRSKKREERHHFDVEYRALSVTLTITADKITGSRFNTDPAVDRPHHATLMWEDVTTDKHDSKLVKQVFEIDLKADFLRRLHKPNEEFTTEHSTRPIAESRKDHPVEIFMIHHTAGPHLSGAIVDMTNKAVKNRAGVKRAQFKGVHFINDRDGHIIRLVDDHYATRHGGGKAKFPPAWRGKPQINNRAIGVENVQGRGVEFTAAQITSLKSLLRAAHDVYGIEAHDVIGHGDVFSGKSFSCPGSKFPWQDIEDDRLGLKPSILDPLKDAATLTRRREVMFSGFFSVAGRELKPGDVELRGADGAIVKRGNKVIADKLGQALGPISLLHHYLRLIGYVPSRGRQGVPTSGSVTEDRKFDKELEAAVLLFHGRHQVRLGLVAKTKTPTPREWTARKTIGRASADVIFGCIVTLGLEEF